MKQYIKNGQLLKKGQPIEIGDMIIYNPNESDYLANGWKIYEAPVVPEPSPEERERYYWEYADYDSEVNKKIREKYSESQEFAILRQRDTKSNEFDVYNSYCEECKNHVKGMMAKYPRPTIK